ncbi:9153_t:CDS:2, partial [Ambispora leptoticha]
QKLETKEPDKNSGTRKIYQLGCQSHIGEKGPGYKLETKEISGLEQTL